METMIKFIIATALLLSTNLYAASTPITAQAWLVADENGKVLEGVNTGDVRSIASITKLITVMTVLDGNQSLDEIISTKLYRKQLSRRMLMEMAIVKSDNNAATILCEQYTGGYYECLHMMNRKVQELEMFDTRLLDSTGLRSENVSTPTDLLKLVQAASNYPFIVETSKLSNIKLQTKKNKWITLHNTNPLVGHGYDFIVSKTGFINKSGGCIVMKLNTLHGIRTVVLLGSKNTRTRIPEAALISKLY